MYMAAKLIDLPASRQMRRAVNTTTNLCMLEMLSAASATTTHKPMPEPRPSLNAWLAHRHMTSDYRH